MLRRPIGWVIPYVMLWYLVGLLPFQPTDLDIFFWPSAKMAIAGQPLMVYAANGQDAYPNANGPVSLLPLTLAGLLLQAAGQLDSLPQRRAVALAVFSLFVLLMAREAVAAIERIRGGPLPTYMKLLAYAVLTLGTPIWQSVAGYGHIEQPIEIWLVLVAVRYIQTEKMMPAGIAFGLAVLSRSSAVLLSIPLGLAALRAGPARTIRLFAATAAIGLAVLLPFVVADSSDVIHSLFTYRGGLVVGAGSVWSLTHGTSLEQVAQHWDIAAIVAVVLASSLWLASRPGGLDQGRLFAGLTLASAGFAMLAKTVWPYYFFEPYVFGTVWAIGSWHPASGLIKLGLPALAFSVFGLVAEIGSDPILTPIQVQIEGAGMFAMLGLTAVWIAWNAAAHAAVQEAWK
ncbi:MAG: hypothetical protein E6I34_01600 [Chloroflexi bacterium]|nr:MAG: hypothetical protein E6I34_01600 [Chloroflexota bacterium]